MASTFIPALIIQHRNDVKLTDGVFGEAGTIPTPGSGGVIDGDYWAIPVTSGTVSGVTYEPTTPGASTKPDVQAFHVVRITSRFTSDDWYVLGTSTEYIDTSSDAECCEVSSPPNVMPDTQVTVVPCQTICSNSDGAFLAILGLPTLAEGEHYFPVGYFNGVALTASDPSGYVDTTALLVFLNANWTNGNLAATWAVSGDHLTLTDTLSDGDDTNPDTLCAAVLVV